MRNLHRHTPVALALLLAFLSSSCGFLTRTRTILRHGKPLAPGTQTLLSATRQDLENRLSRVYAAITSFQATADLTPSVGSVYKGQITEIKDVRAYVLFRKAADIRIIGQTPVVRTTAFDMVSDGVKFSFYLPTKNLFVSGSNDAPATSKNKIENLRPEAFLSSMLIRPLDPAKEASMLVDMTDEEGAVYVLWFLRRGKNGEVLAQPGRTVWFDRADLSIVRQMVYDPDGNILSDTRYSKWQPWGDAFFPAHIDINRPTEGYGVVLDIVDMQMNKGLTDEKFLLNRPEGAQLQQLDGTGTGPAPVRK